MSLELEDRLRAMYAAVADTTEVGDDILDTDGPRLVALSAPQPRTTIRRARLVALVAAAAAVLAGLVFVVNGHHDRKPTASLKDRPFAVPTYVPTGYALVQAEVIALEQIPGFPDGGDEVAHLVYSGPGGRHIDVYSMLDTGAAPLPNTPFTIALRQPGGNRVSVRAVGLDVPVISVMESSMWWVTGPMFTELTAKSGFVDGTYDPWTPPGDDPTVTMRVRGSLQGPSLGFVVSTSGFTFGGSPLDTCSALGTYRSASDNTVLLRSFSPIESFRVTEVSGRVLDVPAGTYPGLPHARFATVRIDRPQSLPSRVECLGGQP